MIGIINVNKPAGMTSQQVVGWIRKVLKQKKAGHTGTLDPGVTGVLPVCLGRATKVAQWLSDQDKSYQGELTLGKATTTQDRFGETIKEHDSSNLTEAEIRKVFVQFEGKQLQIPPMVSAVKHQGKRLYQLARSGIEVERLPREISIYQLTIVSISDIGTANPKILFDVTCSKGTYIRTLCADIGEALGTCGHMSNLVRTKSGPFTLAEAHSFEDIITSVEQAKVDELVISLDVILGHLPRIIVRDTALTRVQNGNALYLAGVHQQPQEIIKPGDSVRIYSSAGQLLAIARAKANPEHQEQLYYQPETMF